MEHTSRSVFMNSKLWDELKGKFSEFMLDKKKRLKAIDGVSSSKIREGLKSLSAKLSQLETRISFISKRYPNQHKVKAIFLAAHDLPLIKRGEKRENQEFHKFLMNFFDEAVPSQESKDASAAGQTPLNDDPDLTKVGEIEERLLRGVAKEKIGAVMELLYPGLTNVAMEESVCYDIGDANFHIAPEHQQFNQMTGCAQHGSDAGGYVEFDFVLKAHHPTWGERVTPPNSPMMDYVLADSLKNAAPLLVLPVTWKTPQKSLQVKDCLPGVFLLFQKGLLLPYQTGGLLKK